VTGRIPQTFINDLIDRVDIVDVIDARMTLKKTGKNYSGLCPFHDEKTPSFSVSPDKQFYHCFGCQESGTALGFIMAFDRLEFVEAVEMLAAQMGLEVPREGGGRPRPQIDPGLYDVLDKTEQYFRAQLRHAPAAIDYLKSRGLTGQVARDFGIGYAPPGWQNLSEAIPGVRQQTWLDAGLQIKNDRGRVYDRFRERIMFPIRDTRGRVVGFGGRVFASPSEAGSSPSADGPKYLNSPETAVFHKGTELYGLYEARRALRNIESLVVVEGYMDVVALAQHGVANTVATLGTATGEAHFQKLYRYADEVICCFDGDQAGRQAAWKALDNALPVLNEHRQLKLMFLPDGEDPDSLIRAQGKAGFEQFVGNAVPGLEYLFSKLGQGLDLQTVDGQAKFAALVNPYVEKVPPGLLRELLTQKVARITGHEATLPQSPSPPRPPRRPPQGQKGQEAGARLLSRLLTLVFKYPSFWTQLDAEVRAAALSRAADLGLFGEIVSYIEARPGTDIEALLVQFSDHEASQDLLRRAQAPMVLGEAELKLEFNEGVSYLMRNLLANQRQQALHGLKAEPSEDKFRQYLNLHESGSD